MVEKLVAYFEKMIWVLVSQILNEERIMRVMLKQWGEDDSRIDESFLLHKIHQILGDKACLTVIHVLDISYLENKDRILF